MMSSREGRQLQLWKESQKITNVASVPHRSPFRYPGGKTWLVPQIRQWLYSIPEKPKLFIEPFAGGGIVSLTVAFEDLADKSLLVELDKQVGAVWDLIVNTKTGAEWLAEKIMDFDISVEAVESILNSKPRSRKARAFRTIVQNRVSHGGILAPGAGLLKHGENGRGISSRWYPETLNRRILEIGAIRDRISFIEGDGFEVIKKYEASNKCVFFVDPPYTVSKKKAGRRLYVHHKIDHEALFSLMARVAGDFLVTYDNAEEVRSLAAKHRFETRQIAMRGTHNKKRKELLIGRDLSWVPEY